MSVTPTKLDHSLLTALLEAVQRYFDLMYDCEVSRFGQVFAASSQLHGYRDGEMKIWPAAVYKDVLAKRQSPKSAGAARVEEILMVDFASASQAFTKVRVGINGTMFVDYLTWHHIDGKWLITGKGYHIESAAPQRAAA